MNGTLRLRALATVLVAIGLGSNVGCAAPPRSAILQPNTAVAAGDGVVFGDISTNVKMSDKSFVYIIDVERSVPMFAQPLSGKRTPFYWHLKPGNYAIFKIAFISFDFNWVKARSQRVYAKFRVDSSGRANYLGCLNLTLTPEQAEVSLVDDFEAAVSTLKANYPLVTGEPAKNLFKLQTTR